MLCLFYEQRVCLICRYVLGVYNSRTEVMKMYDTEMITLQPKVLGKLSEGLICRFEGCDYSHLSLRETSSGPALTPGGGGGKYCHIWAIWVCAAVKGMVFKQFTLG